MLHRSGTEACFGVISHVNAGHTGAPVHQPLINTTYTIPSHSAVVDYDGSQLNK